MAGIVKQEDLIEWLGERANDLTFERAINLFESVYMASRNFSPRTRVEYKTDVMQLAAFLAIHGVTKPAEVGLPHLQSFLAELDAKGLTGVSRRRKVASIRSLFSFLASSRLIPHNPTAQLVPPEREYREPRYLTQSEYEALLRAAKDDARDFAIIELILQTGIRVSEAARLMLQDIELSQHISRDPSNTGRMFISGKGIRERILPLNYKVCQALKPWLSVRPENDSSALFVTKFGEAMRPRAIEAVVTKYLKKAHIEGASCHSLRHTFGTHHVMKGTDLRTIQAAMGHADLRSTSIYVSMAKEAMKRQLQEHAL